MSIIKLGKIDEIPWQKTSHGVGRKKVLFQGLPVTQIAVSEIQVGEVIESHKHDDMDEFFLIQEGVLNYAIGDFENGSLKKDEYVYIEHGNVHSFYNDGPALVRMITFAVIVDKKNVVRSDANN